MYSTKQYYTQQYNTNTIPTHSRSSYNLPQKRAWPRSNCQCKDKNIYRARNM